MGTNLYVHITGTGRVGHASIEVSHGGPFSSDSDYYGYYPEGADGYSSYLDGDGNVATNTNENLHGYTESEVVRGDQNDPTHHVSDPIPITPAQEQALQDYLDGLKNNPGNYDFDGGTDPDDGRNCVDFVQGALDAADTGINIGDLFTDDELSDADGAGYFADYVYGDQSLLETYWNFIECLVDQEIEECVEAITDAYNDVNDGLEDINAAAAAAAGALGRAIGAGLTSPIVFDLDRDGLELKTLYSPVFFDIDADGFAEQMGWVGPDDGFLVRDLNGNGVIDNIGEMFGDNGATTAWQKLAALDTTGNGVVNGGDTGYGSLRIWKDANQNGVTDSGELLTLSSQGITGINIAEIIHHATIAGHTVDGKGTTTGSGGITFYDVFFQTERSAFIISDRLFLLTPECFLSTPYFNKYKR